MLRRFLDRHTLPYLAVQVGTLIVCAAVAALCKSHHAYAQMTMPQQNAAQFAQGYPISSAQAYSDAIAAAQLQGQRDEHMKDIDHKLDENKDSIKRLWAAMDSADKAIAGFSSLQSNGLTIIGVMNACGIGVAVQTARKRKVG